MHLFHKWQYQAEEPYHRRCKKCGIEQANIGSDLGSNWQTVNRVRRSDIGEPIYKVHDDGTFGPVWPHGRNYDKYPEEWPAC
jgi:hypothetical protein